MGPGIPGISGVAGASLPPASAAPSCCWRACWAKTRRAAGRQSRHRGSRLCSVAASGGVVSTTRLCCLRPCRQKNGRCTAAPTPSSWALLHDWHFRELQREDMDVPAVSVSRSMGSTSVLLLHALLVGFGMQKSSKPSGNCLPFGSKNFWTRVLERCDRRPFALSKELDRCSVPVLDRTGHGHCWSWTRSHRGTGPPESGS
mmetsp:Transcript_57060/g.153881  ORF Transcript_57060/g.153881 Transcript_57060/m.153881 type:complete len:201 (+) Transcript_57060:121-723(+)